MTNIILRYALLISLFILLSINSNASQSLQNNSIILKINTGIITLIDVKNEILYLSAINKNFNNLQENEKFNIAKNSLVREVIKKDELKKFYKFGTNPQKIDFILKNLYSKLNLANTEAAKNYFNSYGLEIDSIRSKLEVEALWNTFIYEKYSSQLIINKNELKKKINENDKTSISYSLFEILYKGKNKKEIDSKKKEILDSISLIGFENTASKFSFSDTAKFGGKIGWVEKKLISPEIIKEIENLEIGEITNFIDTARGQLILKLDNIKEEEIEIDLETELNKLIINEKNNQLNNYSNIYFNKIKLNAIIHEK